MTPKAEVAKERTDEFDFIKIEKFCASNDSNHRVKRQPTEWEKIFTNHIPDKGLIPRIYRKFLKFNKKPNNSIQKWAKDSKEDIQIASKHMKRCSTSLIITEMQIKTTRYHLTTTGMATTKKSQGPTV